LAKLLDIYINDLVLKKSYVSKSRRVISKINSKR